MLFSHLPVPGVPGPSVIMGGPPCPRRSTISSIESKNRVIRLREDSAKRVTASARLPLRQVIGHRIACPMEQTKVPTRADIPDSEKWDLSHLFVDVSKW